MSINFQTTTKDPKTLKKGELFFMFTQEQYKKIKQFPKKQIKVSQKEFSAEKNQYTKFFVKDFVAVLLLLQFDTAVETDTAAPMLSTQAATSPMIS